MKASGMERDDGLLDDEFVYRPYFEFLMELCTCLEPYVISYGNFSSS